jgi:pterin-4a-carbinolamine dehydratase
MNEQEFMKGMAYLMNAFPDVEVKDGTLEVYWDMLQSISAKDFEVAIRTHLSKCKWWPKISELLQLATPEAPSPRDVWVNLLAAAETGVKPELDAPGEAGLNAVGGWEVLQFTEYKDLEFRFRDFKEAYQSAANRKEVKSLSLETRQAPLLGGGDE